LQGATKVAAVPRVPRGVVGVCVAVVVAVGVCVAVGRVPDVPGFPALAGTGRARRHVARRGLVIAAAQAAVVVVVEEILGLSKKY
jgi:hypothetical protein